MPSLRLLLVAALLLSLTPDSLRAEISQGRQGSQRPPKLDTKELSKPIVVKQLAIRPPGGTLPDSEAVRVRLTNPNPYTVLFSIRPVKDDLYAGNVWKVFRPKKQLWLWQTRSPFGGQRRDYALAPGQSVEVLAVFFHQKEDHDIYITFRKEGDRLTVSNQLIHQQRFSSSR